MVTFNQQTGLLGQQANPAVSDTTQNQNRAGFPNAKPLQQQSHEIRAIPQPYQKMPTQGLAGMQRLPNPGPRTGPMFDPRQFWANQGPRNGNMPGVGAFGVPAGSFGRIEKGAWNDPNQRRGMGSPFGGQQFPPDVFRAMPMNDDAYRRMRGMQMDYQTGGPGEYGPSFDNGMVQSRDMVRRDMPTMTNPGGGMNTPPPKTPGGGAPWNPTANRPQQPMAPPNNGGGPTPGTAGAAK